MKKILISIVVVIACGALWYFVSPLLRNSVVNEDIGIVVDSTNSEQDFSDNQIADQNQETDLVQESESTQVIHVQDPIIISKGSFVDADNFHKGSGDAYIIQDADGLRVALDNFSVTNGPDLHVVLSPNKTPHTNGIGEYLDLGSLKGNQGSQSYEIPDSVDMSLYASVVIYCKPFKVVFSSAALQ